MFDKRNDNAPKRAGSESVPGNNLNNFHSSFEKKTKHSLPGRYLESVSNNRILAAANAQTGDRLKLHLESVSLCFGKEIYAADDHSDYVYFPETAVVSHLHNLADGNTIEIAMVGADGATGINALFGSPLTTHQASVSVAGSARRVKTIILRQEFERGGKLQILLLNYFNAYLTQVSQKVACTSFHLMEKRFCSWLLMLQDRTRKNQLALTQEQMAQFLGVHRPSLTKIAKTLSEKRLISYTRGNLHLLDRRGLEAVACECYSSAKTNFQNSFNSAECGLFQ